jgi:hypothetical protein
MAWEDRVVDWYVKWLSLFLMTGEGTDPLLVDRIGRFHKRFIKGGLRLFQVVSAYAITFWIYSSQGFETAVLAVLVGILLAAGLVAKNTKMPE